MGAEAKLRSGLDVARRFNQSLVARTLLFVAFVCLVLASLEAWREWSAHDALLQDTARDTTNLARSLLQHGEDTFEMADAALVGMVERVQTRGRSADELARLTRFLALRVNTLPRIRGLFVYDREGRWLASSLASMPADLNNADRDYFQHHRQTRDASAYLGAPVRSRSGGQWIVTLSRRLEAPDGSFDGVVLATLDVSYFADFYSRFDVGANGTIALLHRNGSMLARFPFEEAAIGRDLSGGPLFQEAIPFATAGSHRYVSPVDGKLRLSGYRVGARFPLVTVVAVGAEDVLAPWRTEVARRAGGVLVLIGLVGWIGWRLAQQAVFRQRAEAARVESEAGFRLLAENCGDLVTRIGIDGRYRYISPASLRILGFTPGELAGRDVMESVHPDDRAELDRSTAQLRRGETHGIVLTYRAQHRDGHEIWLETSVRVSLDPGSGKPDGVVAISRDISERKALEANLRSMAATDGLTGLANRRHFDDVLASLPSDKHLSVLMVDVDNFKAYNDRYGHQAGDACLRQVARAVAAVVGRPDDLVARYGGEELVLLLPRTDSQGAAEVGERARRSVEKLGIAHETQAHHATVTVSIGVATADPRHAGSPSDVSGMNLVAAADAALYQAKRSGRNRVVVASRKVVQIPGVAA